MLIVFLERMRHRPILTLAPINKTQVVGSTAMFKCQFLSDLHPHLGWYEGKVSVPNTTESDFLETLVKVLHAWAFFLYNYTLLGNMFDFFSFNGSGNPTIPPLPDELYWLT